MWRLRTVLAAKTFILKVLSRKISKTKELEVILWGGCWYWVVENVYLYDTESARVIMQEISASESMS
jgi:hypothetical protein